MRRPFLSTRLMKFWCSAVVVATLAVLGASNAFTNCNDPLCIVACKLDTTWCIVTGHMGGNKGYKYFTDDTYNTLKAVAQDQYCIENGTQLEGTVHTEEPVWWRKYPSCTPDCNGGSLTTTGSTGPAKETHWGSETQNIKCEI